MYQVTWKLIRKRGTSVSPTMCWKHVNSELDLQPLLNQIRAILALKDPKSITE